MRPSSSTRDTARPPIRIPVRAQLGESGGDGSGEIALHLKIQVAEVGEIPSEATLCDQVGKQDNVRIADLDVPENG